MICKSWEDARKQAFANARQTKETWVYFTSASGQACCEMYDPAMLCHQDGYLAHPPVQEGKQND